MLLSDLHEYKNLTNLQRKYLKNFNYNELIERVDRVKNKDRRYIISNPTTINCLLILKLISKDDLLFLEHYEIENLKRWGAFNNVDH